MDEYIDRLASLIESDNVEFRRLLRGLGASEKVDARPEGLWRRGDWLGLADVWELGKLAGLGGTILLPSSAMVGRSRSRCLGGSGMVSGHHKNERVSAIIAVIDATPVVHGQCLEKKKFIFSSFLLVLVFGRVWPYSVIDSDLLPSNDATVGANDMHNCNFASSPTLIYLPPSQPALSR